MCHNEGVFLFCFVLFCFFRAAPAAYEIPRLGVQLELQLPAYATHTATWDLNHICDLHHGSRQRRILNSLSKAKDRTHHLMVPSRICFPCVTMGTPSSVLFLRKMILQVTVMSVRRL